MSAATETTSPPTPAPPLPRPPQLAAQPERITFRAILLGMFLVAFLAIGAPYSDNVGQNTYLVGNQLPFTVVTVLAVLALIVNPLLGRRRFTRTETIIALGMMFIAAGLPTSGFFRYFPAFLANTVRFSNNTIWWAHYLGALPDWLLPSKSPTSPIITDFYLGMDPRANQSMTTLLLAWLRPAAAWGTFCLPVMVLFLLFCALMRKQWVEHERLSFPLATLPLQMMDPPEPGHRLNYLWRSRLMWIGAGIPIFVHALNGLHQFVSSVPEIPVTYDISSSLTEFPYSALSGDIKSSHIYFMMIGITYFVPLDVALSVWLFHIGFAVYHVFLQAQGIAPNNHADSVQNLGIVVAYGIMLLWIARHHFRDVARSLREPRRPDEFLSYRSILLGMLACTLIACGFLATAFGNILAPGNWALGFLVIFVILFFGMVLTRLVIDAGIILIQFPSGATPSDFLGFVFSGNPALLSIRQWMVTTFGSYFAFMDQRETLLPLAANATRLGSAAPGSQRRRFFAMLLLALVSAVAMAGVTQLVIGYRYGRQSFNDPAQYWIPYIVLDIAHNSAEPPPQQSSELGHFILGAAAVTLVGAGRFLWSGFPLHPIGLLMLDNWAIRQLWFSVAICWALKLVIVRWGGPRLYQRLKLFFIGLVVGDCLIAALWTVVGLFATWPGDPYRVLPR